MIERAPKSRDEIEHLLLAELRASDGCEGAAGVSIAGCGDSQDGSPNWTIAAFNAGTASDYECERALMSILMRFQGFYLLVQKH